jgi:hypothetical protein
MIWSALVVALFVLLLAAVGWDIYLTTDAIEGNTFSELLREYGMKTPFFPWVFACLAGRWFHPSDTLKPLWSSQLATYLTIGIATLIVIAVGILYKVLRGNEYWIPPWIIVLIGLTFGALVAPVAVTGS